SYLYYISRLFLPSLFLFTTLPPPRSTLFPYTTLFRSRCRKHSSIYTTLVPSKQRWQACHHNIPQALWLSLYVTRPLPQPSGMLRSEEHTSEPSHSQISYAVFCLKKKKK